MWNRRKADGFTLIELMLVVAIIGLLAALAIPNFLRFQARARQSEPKSNLKGLYTTLAATPTKPQALVSSVGFEPERGNRYSYHLASSCQSPQERTGVDIVRTDSDDCIGVDTFRVGHVFPSTYTVIPLAAAVWNAEATTRGLGTSAGVVGSETAWDFLAYAAGDVDNVPADRSDTWSIASSDGELTAECPSGAGPSKVAAGEPFNISNDVTCD